MLLLQWSRQNFAHNSKYRLFGLCNKCKLIVVRAWQTGTHRPGPAATRRWCREEAGAPWASVFCGFAHRQPDGSPHKQISEVFPPGKRPMLNEARRQRPAAALAGTSLSDVRVRGLRNLPPVPRVYEPGLLEHGTRRRLEPGADVRDRTPRLETPRVPLLPPAHSRQPTRRTSPRESAPFGQPTRGRRASRKTSVHIPRYNAPASHPTILL